MEAFADAPDFFVTAAMLASAVGVAASTMPA